MIDLKTIAFCIVLINISLCVPFFIAWKFQKVYPGFGYWVLANMVLSLGYIFNILLRQTMPLNLSVLLSFFLFLLAGYLRLEGLLRFFGWKGRWVIHGAVICGLPLLVVGFSLELGIRTALLTAVLAYYLFRMTWVVFNQAQGKIQKFYKFLAAPFLIYGLLLVSRCAVAFIAPTQVDVSQNTPANVLSFLAAMLLDIGVPLSLLMLNDKQIEKELAETTAQLKLSIADKESLLEKIQLLLDSTMEGIYGVDSEGRCTFINKSGVDMTGYPYEEIIGQDMHALIHHSCTDGSIYKREDCPMGYTLKEGARISSDDEVLWRKNGTFFPVAYASSPVKEGAHIKGAVITFVDITERKKTEGILRETEKQYRELVQNANSVIIRWNREGILTFFNEYAQHFFGYSAAEIIGKHLGLLVPERESTGSDQRTLIQDIINCPERFVNNINENVCRDGRRVWMVWTNKPIFDESGKVVEILAVASDITNLKQAEEKIRKLNEELEQRVKDRTAQLESANKELESFSYSVSHDLRAPLRSIDGFSLALIEDFSDQLSEIGRGYLERIRKATQRMGFLIDDLIKLSQVTRVELKDEPVDLSRTVKTIMETLRQSTPDREVERVIQEGLVARADPYLMRIVVTNLVDNAWKFTSRTKKARIEFGFSVIDGRPAYFVKDNGVGFDMTYVHKLFGPFQRLHAIEDFPGTGIGLATVKRIIARHSGQVWTEGEVGRGAVFYFTLG
jgi:PAS domain S-box-containing protein